MTEQEKNNKGSMICLTPTPSQNFLFYKAKKILLQKKSFLRKTALAIPVKKEPTTSVGKPAHELKVYEKTVRTAIKQNYPLDYALLGLLRNKTKSTSHPNIGSLKTVIEEKRNKMSEEFI